MKILIVCSKHFYNKIPTIKKFLEAKGHTITLPNSYDNPMKEEKMKEMIKKEHITWKRKMLLKDEKNIRPQDAILVLNFEKRRIPNYIGRATFLKIYKAFELKKQIFFYNPLPRCSFTDELVAIDPTIIHGNLEKIQ